MIVAQESPVLSMLALECWPIEQVQAIRIHTSVIFHRELSLVQTRVGTGELGRWLSGKVLAILM